MNFEEKGFLYFLKRAILVFSHVFICLGTFYITMSFIGVSTSDAEFFISLILSMAFVLVPAILIESSLFESFGEAFSYRKYVSWKKVLTFFVCSILFLFVIHASIKAVGFNSFYSILDSRIYAFVWFSMFALSLGFLKRIRVWDIFFPFTQLERAFFLKLSSLVYAYLCLITFFGAIYVSLNCFKDVVKISMSQALYFSVITMTSTGYGDIVPLASCRLAASIQAIIGNLYIPFCFSYFWFIYGNKNLESKTSQSNNNGA